LRVGGFVVIVVFAAGSLDVGTGGYCAAGQLHEAMERKGHELTIKLIAASQPCTASATEDTLGVAQSANVRAGRLTEAILVREGYDPATIAGTDAKDTQRQEALEDVGTGGTSAIERQRDRRALRVGIDRTVSLLAGVLGLGGESDVEAGNEILRGRWVGAFCGETRREIVQSVVSAEVSSNLCQAGLLECGLVCWHWRVRSVGIGG
jgi:hypothetical protein